MRRWTLLLLVVALIAAACGGDDGGLSAGEQELADGLALSMRADGDPGNPFNDMDSAQCFAEGLVGGLGIERLVTLGLTAESRSQQEAFASMSAEELDDVVDVALECTGPEAAMADELAIAGISPGSAVCLADRLGESGFFRDAFIAGLAGQEFDPGTNPEYTALFLEAAAECLTPEELGPLFGGDG